MNMPLKSAGFKPIKIMNQLPTQFFAQALERIKLESPRFYRIIQWVSIGLFIVSLILYYVVNKAMPGIGREVPVWLSFAQDQVADIVAFLSGLGLGAWTVAQTTIKTPSTPPLGDDQLPKQPEQ